MKVYNSSFKKWLAAILILIIILSVLFYLSRSFQRFNPSSVVTPTIIPVSYSGAGIAIGIHEFPNSPAWRTYTVASNTSFKAFLRLLNRQKAETYLLTCLIDYEQVPCTYEDKTTVLYKINMSENEDRLIRFETMPLSNGFHDFSILAIARPDQHDLNQKYRLSTDLNYFYPTRAVILVGQPPYQPSTLDFEHGNVRNYSESELNGVVINTVADSRIIPGWFVQNVKQNELVNYYIHLGNDNGPTQTYVVMSFLDFQQIPVSTHQKNRYVLLNPHERIDIPTSIKVPKENGVHELMVIIAHRPFQPLENPDTGPRRELVNGNFDLENSIRVGIVIQDADTSTYPSIEAWIMQALWIS